MVETYKEEAKKRTIDLVFRMPSKKFPRVLVDMEKMRLVMENLIDNALRYTLPGGKVTVSLQYDKKEIVVSVEDTGIGIPTEQQKRLFEKFFRASNARPLYTEGSGLGLYLVRNIIEAHGGKLSFISQEGRGSTFSFALPVRQEIEEFLKKF